MLLPPYHHIGTAPAAGTASSRQALPQHPELAKEFAQSQVLRCARITSYSIGVEGGGLALCPVGCDALVVSCPRRVGSVCFQWVLGSSPRSVLIKINDAKQR